MILWSRSNPSAQRTGTRVSCLAALVALTQPASQDQARRGLAQGDPIPFGSPVTVDGAAGDTEWRDARSTEIVIPGETPVRVRFKHDQAHLMFCFSGLARGSGRELYPEVLVDVGPGGAQALGPAHYWFHASYSNASARGAHSDYRDCEPGPREGWNANNFPLQGRDIVELVVTKAHLGALDVSALGLAFDVTDTSSRWHFAPAGAELDRPTTWARYRLAPRERTAVASPVVYIVSGSETIQPTRLPYAKDAEGDLTFDLYRPPGEPSEQRPGVVVIANWRRTSMPDWRLMASWCQNLAASGVAAVVYQSAGEPSADLGRVVEHLRTNADTLRIDGERIGVFATSGNTVAAIPYVTAPERAHVRCLVVYYGMVSASDDPNPPRVRADLPVMVVRAGREGSAELDTRLVAYVQALLRANAPLTLVNHTTGHHGFDLVDDDERSREIVRDTLRYFAGHLAAAR